MSSTTTTQLASVFAPLTLNGVSQYSSDLQSILTRAAGIAQIPITDLQNKDAVVLSQASALSNLQSAVGNLASSLTSLGTIAANQGLTATSSNTSAVTATVTGATAPTSFTIDSVTSAAAAASERTRNSFAATDPVSSTGSMQLVVGANKYNFTLGTNTLTGLENQINSLGAGVTASILTTSGGNYLSVTANSTGATTLQLFDDPTGANTNILTNTNQGTDAVFSLNGIPVDQPGNTVNSVIPGVTLNIVGATASPTTVSLTSDATQLTSAVQSFVTNYNAVQSAVAAQEGTSGGPLNGDPLVTQIAAQLRQVASYYSGTGSVNSLTDLGVTFNDATGQATFDGGTAIGALSGSQVTDAFNFVGSASSGLAGFAANFTQYSDPVTGLIQIETTGLQQQDQTLQTEISTKTDQANAAQVALQARLQQADAAIAELQSQQQTLTGSLQSLSLVLFGQNPALLG